jgi:RNA polymerase sigma-70 factor (ECF subfamily)
MQFDRLVARHKDAVYRQMVRMCGNQDDAEDVLAESLLKAWRALGTLDDEASFQAWLAIIARRTCGRMRRREALAPVVHLADLADVGVEPVAPGQAPDDAAIEAHTKQCLIAVMDGLPDIYRDVYVARDVEGLSAEETAQRFGISVAAVKSRLHRARTMVRDRTDQSLLG